MAGQSDDGKQEGVQGSAESCPDCCLQQARERGWQGAPWALNWIRGHGLAVIGRPSLVSAIRIWGLFERLFAFGISAEEWNRFTMEPKENKEMTLN